MLGRRLHAEREHERHESEADDGRGEGVGDDGDIFDRTEAKLVARCSRAHTHAPT